MRASIELLTADELATLLRLPRRSIYRLRSERGLPARRVGRLLRFDPDEVRAWLSALPQDDPAPIDLGARNVGSKGAAGIPPHDWSRKR